MSGRIKRSKGMFLFFLLGLGAQSLAAGTVRGSITDKQTHEPLTGATVTVSGVSGGAVADLEGNYVLQLPAGTYVLTVKFMSYKDLVVDSVRVGDEEQVLNLEMESDVQALNEVAVTAVARRDNEAALLQEQRRSLVVQTGVSAQQMARTQDKDASEVIRRVPGVSIIDEKFVMVRGLSQRYNNVWLNGSAVPSSEADSRAFSFDVLPSSQLDNLIIVKSPAPEYPADFTGGFILIQTKQLPAGNSGSVSVGTGVNDRTHFRAFLHGKGSATDGLGFDNGLRRLDAGLTGDLTPYAGYDGDRPRLDLLNNGLNNDWRICTRHPWGDLKLSMDYNRKWEPSGGRAYGILAAVNYSRTSKTMLDMENSIYGPYDTANDKAVFLRRATDNQYSSDVRWGAMLNFTLQPRDKRHRYEWKNLFNQIAKDRFSERTGFNAQPDNIHTMEYYYSSRSTANTQFTGRHDWNEGGRLDWSTGYAYANRNLPDRRLIERTDRTEQTMGIYRISREFTRLDEHIFSANANYKRDFRWGAFEPTLKTGVYGEYRTRTYRTREFQYGWQPNNTLPDGFLFDNDADNSGIYQYVRVEFAGYPFDTDKEINGITFGSVGSGTTVDHLQVSYSNDDSFEWFGGAVNCKYLVAYKGWDDEFDTDNGFSGTVQYGLSIRDPRIADTSQSNGFESDNNASGAETTPFTTATFKNVTFIGPRTAKNSDFANTLAYITAGDLYPDNGSKLGLFQAAMQIRRSSKLNGENILAVGYPVGLIVDGEKGSSVTYAKNGGFRLKNIIFAGMGVVGTDKNKEYEDYLYDYATGTEDRTQPSFSHTFFLSEPTNKVLTEAELGLTDPKGTGQNYCPSIALPDGNGGYIGAFKDAGDNWLDGWTNFDPQYTAY